MMRRVLKRLLRVPLAAAAVIAIGWLLLGIGPRPLLINRAGFSQAVFDRDDHLLRMTLSSDEKYRLWVPLHEIPPAMIAATLLKEDAWFRWHPGVNPFALGRAFATTYLSRGRREGGSTITMQVARMRFGLDSRTIGGKLTQIIRALQLERRYSKDQILEAYLNLAPYGGNIEGVGAASIVYFGKEPRYLSIPEALTLAVIPQNPRLRNPASASGRIALGRARQRLANAWLQTYRGDSAAQVDSRPALAEASREQLPFRAPHFADRVLAENGGVERITTTLDLGVQELLEQQLSTFVERNRHLGIKNGAVILVDYRSMEVRGYVGSADYFATAIDGQVNGLRGRRSPGSALKPFIYALAIDQGMIQPQTMLKDTALRISAYNPENFDHDFLGPIDATSALVRSRNVPAIELANQLASPDLYGFLQAAGVRPLREENFYGLALALGGVEVSMEEMAQLYALLANGGVLEPLVFITNQSASTEHSSKRLLSPEASYVVLEMLRENPRPTDDFSASQVPAGAAIPWKTGTSYGYRDAWALGIVGPYVLGVWIGNFDGTPNPNFVGRDAAGPLFFSIVDALRARGPLSESIVHGPLNLKRIKVCALSGQLPGPYCEHLKETWFIPGKSPIATCSIHRAVAIDPHTGLRACPGRIAGTVTRVYEFWPSDLLKLFRSAGVPRQTPPPFEIGCGKVASSGAAPLISSPSRGLTYSVGAAGQTHISFTAVTDADSRVVYWFVDDRLVGTSRSGESLAWPARPGTYLVRAVDDQGRSAAQEMMVAPR